MSPSGPPNAGLVDPWQRPEHSIVKHTQGELGSTPKTARSRVKVGFIGIVTATIALVGAVGLATPALAAQPGQNTGGGPSTAANDAIAYAESMWSTSDGGQNNSTYYALGGNGPSAWDCSGLVWKSYLQAGIDLSNGASRPVVGDEYNALKSNLVSRANAEPGDILFWTSTGTTGGDFLHDGIYLGNGYMVAAAAPGEGVKEQTLWSEPGEQLLDVVGRPTGSLSGSGSGGSAVKTTTYVTAAQVNTGKLWSVTAGNAATAYPVGVAAGTSPAIATLGGGKYVTAFQAAGGALWTVDSGGAATSFPVGMKAGTSPSIIPTSGGGYVVAVQTNTGKLWTITNTKAATAFDIGMAAGTSPSIAAVGSGYVVAVQTNTGDLWSVTNTKAATSFGVGMQDGTSPSITATANGGYVIAAQTNTGALWSVTNTKAATAFPIGMQDGTSPSILALSNGGYVIAAQTNTGKLWTITNGKAATAFDIGMASGTSPAIAAVGSGYVVAVQTNGNDLWTVTNDNAATSFNVGMKAEVCNSTS